MEKDEVKKWGFGTQSIHAGHVKNEHGALTTPIYQTSTFCFETVEDGMAKFSKELPGFVYTRGGNPTTHALQEKLAILEKGEACFVTASGMGAIGATLLALLETGDHVICGDCVYGCTHMVLSTTLKKFGIEASFVDTSNIASLEKNLQKNTKLIIFETPTNPTMQLTDIHAVSTLAHRNNIKVVVDNTFAPPPVQYPLELGADIVVHSTTKYLNGHGDVIGGAIIGKKADIDVIGASFGTKICGTTPSPFDSFLVLRGLQTMELRMERHCANGLELATYLQEKPEVGFVAYPGLASHPQHTLAKKQMNNLFGGIISFELKDGIKGLSSYESCKRLLNRLRIPSIAVSLGDPGTLIQHPASMTHNNISIENRKKAGISDGLIRLSVGLENGTDLIADFEQAFSLL